MADTGLGNLTGLLGGVYGYDKLMGDVGKSQENAQQRILDLQNQTQGMTEFQPWSVKSNIGAYNMNQDGTQTLGLNPEQLAFQNNMFRQGNQMMQRASQDPYAREQEVYDRMRATQSPEEQRQLQQMQNQLERQGRGGMRSAMYGGSPEQLAFMKARGENMNSAMLGAMGQAQNELTNQYTMGSGMFNQGFSGMEHLMQQGQLGQNSNSQLLGQQNNAADLWTQLGLGGLTADTNYDNIKGNMFGNLITAGMPLLGGAGDAASGWLSENFPKIWGE